MAYVDLKIIKKSNYIKNKNNKANLLLCSKLLERNGRYRKSGYPLVQLCLLFSLLLMPLKGAAESLQRPALMSPLTSYVLLTDSVNLGEGNGYWGVGVYGSIVHSNDAKTWRQAVSPTQTLLTTVAFVDKNSGWIGGHDTLILHTNDAGKSWEIQYEDPITGGDIPKPILDILFTDETTGYAIGAYGLVLQTSNGGKLWSQLDVSALYDRLDALEMEPEPNFNAAIPFADKILIVGELGTILIFDPATEIEDDRWEIKDSPYAGTFFGVKQMRSGDIYIYGLRGNIYRSADNLQSWEKIKTPLPASIYDCFETPDGKVVFLGAGGTILSLDAGSTSSHRHPYSGFDTLMSGQINQDNSLILFGSRGVKKFNLQSSKVQSSKVQSSKVQ
ncbi:MAG: hypothetical protein KUG82_22705 [Pseudomonadales bacterium]|nr:hypothetical protein [Pseudomonadales bacterium]